MDSPMEFHLVEFNTATSTNDLIKQAIDNGSSEGLVVRADEQSGGYGRYKRAWSSPKGGLYMSVLLRPDNHIEDAAVMATKLPTLSLLVSIAVRKAILNAIGNDLDTNVKIKWPNDIIYKCDSQLHSESSMFHKLCGISMEKHGDAICVGIGINVKRADECSEQSHSAEPLASADSVTHLSGRNSKRNSPAYLAEIVGSDDRISVISLCYEVVSSLAVEYPKWLERPFEDFKRDYDSALALTGLQVSIEDSRSTVKIEGEVMGVDDQGRLLVQTHKGALERVSSGEAHVNLV